MYILTMNRYFSGQKFNMLTAIEETQEKGFWLFACECGSMTKKNIYSVKYNNTKSCGCYRRKISSENSFKDKTGRKYGRLLVVKKLGVDRHRHTVWGCICDCGKTTQTTTLGTKYGTKSCGCLQREDVSRRMRLRKQNNPISQTAEYRKNIRKKRRSSPENYLHEKISRMLCHALEGIQVKKGGKTFSLLGYSPAELVVHVERQFLPGMNWDNRNLWHIDHIVPISTAKTKEDVIYLNQLSNLRPIWAKDNLKKNNKRTHLL